MEHLNKHNVIYITFSKPISDYTNYAEYISGFKKQLIEDLNEKFEIEFDENDKLGKIFENLYNQKSEGFVFITDEWDYTFNNNLFSENDRKDFLKFLRSLLKDKPYVELAYMTGVLPIEKYSSGSALNMFKEYNMLNDGKYDKYFGFIFALSSNCSLSYFSDSLKNRSSERLLKIFSSNTFSQSVSSSLSRANILFSASRFFFCVV